jgi:hypothetical protein
MQNDRLMVSLFRGVPGLLNPCLMLTTNSPRINKYHSYLTGATVGFMVYIIYISLICSMLLDVIRFIANGVTKTNGHRLLKLLGQQPLIPSYPHGRPDHVAGDFFVQRRQIPMVDS